MFPCKFCEISKNTFFTEHVWATALLTFEEFVKKIQIKFKILDLAVKENERIISRNKVNELVKQQKAF